jgi:hypothetical protein
MDLTWWKLYISEVNKSFKGERFSNNKQHASYNVTHVQNLNGFGNSGAAAISLAVLYGAKNIILLGYDCQLTNNQSHWHGDHPKILGNAKLIDKWQDKFEKLAQDLKDVNIINATRETALNMFKKVNLEDAIS